MNSSKSITFASPPTSTPTDRTEIALLFLMFCVGAPINLASFSRLLKQRSLGRNGRLNLLKLHLNATDLLILFVYATGVICWKITYAWRGGAVLCKAYKFLSSTSFQASSNLIVAVALDRLFTVLNGRSWYKKRFKRPAIWYVRLCLFLAWLSSVIINAPQLYVWRIYTPYPVTRPDWQQCTTLYAIQKHKNRYGFSNDSNASRSAVGSDTNWKPAISQLSYDLTHVLLVFWIPAALIIVAYSFVLIFLYRLETRRRQDLVLNRNEMEKELSEGLDNNLADFHIQHDPRRRRESRANYRRSSSNKEFVLSAISAGNQLSSLATDNRKESQSTNASSFVYLVPTAISRVRNNTFRISFMLIAAYLLFWTPYNALALWQFIDEDSYKRQAQSARCLNTLIVMNSVVNPFLYGAIRIRKFDIRKYIRK